jgi:biopolymer transport protein ExbD
MKKIIVWLLASIVVGSCTEIVPKERYFGKWIAVDLPQELPNYIHISADSISYSENEVIWNATPITINSDHLSFDGQTFQTKVSEDLLWIENQAYKKLNTKAPIEIALPKLKTYTFDEGSLRDPAIDIFYGKKSNSDSLSVQYKGKIVTLDGIRDSLAQRYNDVYRNVYQVTLHCDKNILMKDIETLFLNIRRIGFENVYLVNDVSQKFKTEFIQAKLHKEVHSIKFMLDMNPAYRTEIPTQNSNTRSGYMTYLIKNNKPFQYTFLIDNAFYYGKEKLSKQAFSKTLKTLIQDNIPLFMLYDLESSYEKYLEMSSIYKQQLDEVRNEVAIATFNTAFNALPKVQKEQLKNSYRYLNIRQYSIPHFLSFEEAPYLDFSFQNTESQIPQVYFKK